MINVASFLDISARRCPEATAFIYRDRQFSFAEIERCANRIANGLVAEGFGPGSRIALCSHNRPAMPAAYFGILKTGATAIMLNAHCTRRDIRQGLRDSGAEALLSQATLYDRDVSGFTAAEVAASETCRKLWFLPDDLEDARPLQGHPTLQGLMAGRSDRFSTAPVMPGQVAVVAFTSGTTGRRKGVQNTHDNIAAMVTITAQLGDPDDCRIRLASNTLECLMGQIYTMVQPVYQGHCTVLVEAEDPELILRELLRWRASYMIDVPSVFAGLMEAARGRDLDALRRDLRICVTGGAGMAADLPERFAEIFGTRLLPGYGATETSTTITWSCPRDRPVPGSVGRPIPGVTLRLLDREGQPCAEGEPGEIWVRSPGVMKGYMDMPEATRRVLVDGWYRTSDLGQLGEGGELHLHRRIDNKINQGVDQVDPDEVVSILLEHPAVADARVLSEPHPVLGQLARTFVLLDEGRVGVRADPEALLAWLKGELPYGKAPERLEIVSRLPGRADSATSAPEAPAAGNQAPRDFGPTALAADRGARAPEPATRAVPC